MARRRKLGAGIAAAPALDMTGLKLVGSKASFMQGNVGSRVREARKARGLTLQDLSERSGLSVSQLSKLETGKARLTVDMALVIAGVLQAPVAALLSMPKQGARARRSITRAGSGIIHQGNGMRFEVLCSDFRDKANVFWRVTLTARTFEENGRWRSHSGEEFVHVLDGTLELHTIDYDPVVLNPGDSILFDGEMEHAYVALGDEPVVMLMSNSVQREGVPAIVSDVT